MSFISEAAMREVWGTEDLYRVREQARLVVGSLSEYVHRSKNICGAIAEAADQEVLLYLSADDLLVRTGGNPLVSVERVTKAFQWRDDAIRFIEMGLRDEASPLTFLNARSAIGFSFRGSSTHRETLLLAAGNPVCRRTLTASLRWMDDVHETGTWVKSFIDLTRDLDQSIDRQIHCRMIIFAAAAVAAVGIATVIAITWDS